MSKQIYGNTHMKLDIYTQHMFKNLGGYKYSYCVNVLIDAYICALIFMEIFVCMGASVAMFCQ